MVEEILNYDNSRRVMFEPFDPAKNQLISHWELRQFVDLEEKRSEFTESLEK